MKAFDVDARPPFFTRLLRRIKSDGLTKTTRYAWSRLLHELHYQLYDRSFESEEVHSTSQVILAHRLDLKNEDRKRVTQYMATPRLLVRWAIEAIPAPLETLHFVDIGSGLGRVLMVAAEYPFRSVTGYELSTSLHKGAQANLCKLHATSSNAKFVQSIQADALVGEWPQGPCVFFLFNPFDDRSWDNFRERLELRAKSGIVDYTVLVNTPGREIGSDFRRARIPFGKRALIWLLSPYQMGLFTSGRTYTLGILALPLLGVCESC